MEASYVYDSVRERLIIAGTEEISLHGPANFSLRRVAAACDISCAAPYKHFKNKEDFLREILRYITRQWELFRDQLLTVYPNDLKKQILEISVAYIRFWIANPNYRSLLSSAGEDTSDPILEQLLCDYARKTNASEEESKRLPYAIRALIYGTTTLLDSGELSNTEESFSLIRRTLEKEL